MKFEWDEGKNAGNVRKHRLDFCDADEIFKCLMLTRLDTKANYGEDRYIGFGFVQERLMVVVYTERASDSIRIISFRKANKREKALFQKEIKDRLG